MSQRHRSTKYEKDDETFPATAYAVNGWGAGVAWYVLGWETEPDSDTEWTGIEERTGKVLCVMVGDDRRFAIDPDDLTALDDEDYCGGCGQVGCCADGRAR
jgi:hypothetical protein